MNRDRGVGGRSRRLALVLLGVAVVPAATLVWLGLRLLEQDRALLAQRDFERRQAAIQAATHALQRSLSDAERSLLGGPVPDGMVRLTMSSAGVHAEPADRVAWLPVGGPEPAVEDAAFAEAERLEYQGSPERALLTYRELSRSPRPAIRAGALLREARVHRSRQRWDEAIRAYRDLTQFDVRIEGTPASLQARRAICAVLAESGRMNELKREATTLERDLLAGRWMLDRAAWELTVSELERWTGHAVAVSEERRTFSAVADVLRTPDAGAVRYPRVITVHTSPMTVLSRLQGTERTSLAVSTGVLRRWIEAAVPTASRGDHGLSLLGAAGELLAGRPPPPGASTVRAEASETGLPWTLALSANPSSTTATELASRRQLLSAGLAAILLLVAGGSYFLWRVVQRELAVARLQTEFMAAVSHEFRTPLTSLRHVTELLQEGDEVPRDRRRAFYDLLGRNTERLHRLVESLLDFARMESGRKPYDLRCIDASAVVAEVVADFRHEVAPRGYVVELDLEAAAPAEVRADAAALSNALWNLLDNAAKYSPDARVIRVRVHREGGAIAISIQDNGLGVPASERTEIFGRFVRGRTASRLGIKGTGLGLAMAAHIVDAHGGSIELESEEGIGSTFTIVLPEVSSLKSHVTPATSRLRLET